MLGPLGRDEAGDVTSCDKRCKEVPVARYDMNWYGPLLRRTPHGGWGLMGFGVAIAVLQVAALRFGSAIALSLALATGVSWNLGLWWIGRRRVVR